MKNRVEFANGNGNARTDQAMANLVERGVAFHPALGRTVATAYLRDNAVPSDVIYRVFGGDGTDQLSSVPSRSAYASAG